MARMLHIPPMLLAVLLYSTGLGFALHVQTFHGDAAAAGTAARTSCHHHHHHHHHSGAPHSCGGGSASAAPGENGADESQPDDIPLPHDCPTCDMLHMLSMSVGSSTEVMIQQEPRVEPAPVVAQAAAGRDTTRIDGARAPPRHRV